MRTAAVCVCLLAVAVLAGSAGGGGTPRLLDSRDCSGFTCATLRVPLDYSGRTPGTLDLAVAMGKKI